MQCMALNLRSAGRLCSCCHCCCTRAGLGLQCAPAPPAAGAVHSSSMDDDGGDCGYDDAAAEGSHDSCGDDDYEEDQDPGSVLPRQIRRGGAATTPATLTRSGLKALAGKGTGERVVLVHGQYLLRVPVQ